MNIVNLILTILIGAFISNPKTRWYYLLVGLTLKMVEVLLTPYQIWRHNMKEQGQMNSRIQIISNEGITTLEQYYTKYLQNKQQQSSGI